MSWSPATRSRRRWPPTRGAATRGSNSPRKPRATCSTRSGRSKPTTSRRASRRWPPTCRRRRAKSTKSSTRPPRRRPTRGGAMPRIDAHGHLIPERYRAELERLELETGYPLPPATPEIFSGLMDRYGIDAAVVSLSPPGVWFGDPGLAKELARLVNEETAALVREQPARDRKSVG